MPLPRNGDELAQMIMARLRWYAYRIRFHPWTTEQLPKILGTVHDYIRLTRLDRPIGIWLLLWPTLWAVWIASRGQPKPLIFIIFVAGTVLMRSAGCAINDYADRSFDPQVERTKDRPLAAGRLTALEALVLFAILSLAALVLALQLNRLTLAVGGGRRVHRRHVSVREAIPVGAADVLGTGLRRRNSRWRSPRSSNSCRGSRGCCCSPMCCG